MIPTVEQKKRLSIMANPRNEGGKRGPLDAATAPGRRAETVALMAAPGEIGP